MSRSIAMLVDAAVMAMVVGADVCKKPIEGDAESGVWVIKTAG